MTRTQMLPVYAANLVANSDNLANGVEDILVHYGMTKHTQNVPDVDSINPMPALFWHIKTCLYNMP